MESYADVPRSSLSPHDRWRLLAWHNAAGGYDSISSKEVPELPPADRGRKEEGDMAFNR